jgi:uncharacterized membrane protein (DUF106 family)
MMVSVVLPIVLFLWLVWEIYETYELETHPSRFLLHKVEDLRTLEKEK